MSIIEIFAFYAKGIEAFMFQKWKDISRTKKKIN